MTKVSDMIAKKYSPVKKVVSESYYNEKKDEIPENEFNKKFIRQEDANAITYYEIVADIPEDSDLTKLLIDKLLEQQTVATIKLKIISGIMIFYLICSVVAAIILATTL